MKAASRYKPRMCEICGKEYSPTGAREKICPECRKHACCVCGGAFLANYEGKPYCRKHWTKIKESGNLDYERGPKSCQFIEDGDILRIVTAKGQTILVDAEDADKVRGLSWSASGCGYPKTYLNGKMVAMHQIILGDELGDGMVADHKNRNKLDNRRSNFRICTRMQNSWNASKGKRNRSGVRGVTITKEGRYLARIMANGVEHRLGTFATLEEAAEARRKGEDQYHGEFAGYKVGDKR